MEELEWVKRRVKMGEMGKMGEKRGNGREERKWERRGKSEMGDD